MADLIGFHFPHKTASMLAWKLFVELASSSHAPLFSQNNQPANHHHLANGETLNFQGLAFRGPVRNFSVITSVPEDQDVSYRFETPDLLFCIANYKAVCQVRDILDLIVSLYFSHGWIHPLVPSFAGVSNELQSGNISVYDYAIMELEGRSSFGQASIVSKYNDLKTLKNCLGPDRFLLVTYEEMMLDYSSWSGKICRFIPEVASARRIFARAKPVHPARQIDESESYADPLEYVRKHSHKLQHIRSPFPGDHRRFLTTEEIVSLRELIARQGGSDVSA